MTEFDERTWHMLQLHVRPILMGPDADASHIVTTLDVAQAQVRREPPGTLYFDLEFDTFTPFERKRTVDRILNFMRYSAHLVVIQETVSEALVVCRFATWMDNLQGFFGVIEMRPSRRDNTNP